MSAFLLSKLHIDLLVTLGISGPAEADQGSSAWRPAHLFYGRKWPASADDLGEVLWRANAENVLDPEGDGEELPPRYVYEPFPYPITAVEGLKAVSCYVYQTADDRDRWEGSMPEAFCHWLEDELIGQLPGFDAAPWDWNIPDLDAKADQVRVATLNRHAGAHAPIGPDVAGVIKVLASNGIELKPHPDVDNDLPAGIYVPIDRDFQARPSQKVGHWSSVNRRNRREVQVRAYADDAAAHVGYLLRRSVHEHIELAGQIEWTRYVARHGRVVVDLARHPGQGSPVPDPRRMTLQQHRDALAALGRPDESWSTEDLPIISDTEGGSVVCQRIALPNAHADRAVQVATDSDSLRRLAVLVDDEHDRQKVLDIDPETHTAFMIHGVASADRITRARMQELASPPGSEPKYLLDLSVEELRWTPAVVVVIDKLPERPTEVVIRQPGAHLAPLTPFRVYG